MKIRQGFVSNSSSTTFICELCGHSEYGFDWELIPSIKENGNEKYERNWGRCKNGHLLCKEHFSLRKYKCEMDEIPSQFCPLCRSSTKNLEEFLKTKRGKSVDEVLDELYNGDNE
jgi:hypothetical protein